MATSDQPDSNRRQILTIALGGAALATLAAGPAYAAKVSKASVRYQDSPKDGKKCGGCKLFLAPNACKNVAGEISPNGWCAIWVKA